MNSISLYISHLSGLFIIIIRQAFHEHLQYITRLFLSAHYNQTEPCALRPVLMDKVSCQTYYMYRYDTDTSDSERACLYQHIRTLYCGPEVTYVSRHTCTNVHGLYLYI